MVKAKIAVFPGTEAIAMALEIYDSAPARDPKKLTNNKPVELVTVNELPKEYSSGKLVDLNLGELLSMGVISSYLNNISNNTISYPVVVGVGDSDKKAYREIILSDGALKDSTGTTGAMPFQQIMAQGYYPTKKVITAESIKEMIKKKASRRQDYPDNCGLIVNVYSEQADIDLRKIIEDAVLDAFQLNLLVLYHMPSLDKCIVYRLEPGMSSETLKKNHRKFLLTR